ncbi:MAG: efflux RND transporter permease subunit [Kiritimatiellae bacterium]|nr:efflux RND transporter permease subunit [Kiritimatiellia bacterium]
MRHAPRREHHKRLWREPGQDAARAQGLGRARQGRVVVRHRQARAEDSRRNSERRGVHRQDAAGEGHGHAGRRDGALPVDRRQRPREVLSRSAQDEQGAGEVPAGGDCHGGFYTDTPKLRVVVDRAKCELMKVPMSSIYTVLQHNLGSIYVNDVNLGTQVNRVTAMADWSGRASPDDIRDLYVRSKTGAMVPIDTLVTCREELGPRSCYRCDQYLYCTEQFVPKPGVSSSEAIEEVLRICREKLSPGFRNDWAGFTYESLKSRGDEGLLFGLSILLAYLVLVAYRESWRGAFRSLLPSVAAVFGALLALWAAGVAFSVYSRHALAMLVASTAAMSLVAGRGAGFRARLMLPLLAALTALPLVFASGAGSAGSRSFGVTLFGGYLAYALLGGLLSSLAGDGRPTGACAVKGGKS